MTVRAGEATNSDAEKLGFKTMRSGIKEAADENLLTPRFYTTDFDEMEQMFSEKINPNLDMDEFVATLKEFQVSGLSGPTSNPHPSTHVRVSHLQHVREQSEGYVVVLTRILRWSKTAHIFSAQVAPLYVCFMRDERVLGKCYVATNIVQG